MPRMTGRAQGVDRNYSLKIDPDLYCMNICTIPIVPAKASKEAGKMIHQNYIANIRELPHCNILSSDLELLDSFKYAEIESRIRLDVETNHPKVLS